MPVMGRDALVVSDTGRVMEVNPFTPDYDAIRVKLVDAALKYNCPHEDKSYILLVRNALHVPSMDHNLIPPFMLREAGITVNETPKIHKENPTVDDHAITFPNSGLRIPMGLWGVFSYFPTSKPSTEEVNTSENVYTLTPNRWNPHAKQYANCEQNLIDWEGKVLGKTTEMKIILADIQDDEGMTSSMMVASAEIRYMDALEMDDDVAMDTHPKYQMIPHDANEVASILGEVSPLCDSKAMYQLLKERGEISHMSCALGSTTVAQESILIDRQEFSDNESVCSVSSIHSIDDAMIDELFNEVTSGSIDIDEYLVSSTHMHPSVGVNEKHLSKVIEC
jgi:hypothetical protein